MVFFEDGIAATQAQYMTWEEGLDKRKFSGTDKGKQMKEKEKRTTWNTMR